MDYTRTFLPSVVILRDITWMLCFVYISLLQGFQLLRNQPNIAQRQTFSLNWSCLEPHDWTMPDVQTFCWSVRKRRCVDLRISWCWLWLAWVCLCAASRAGRGLWRDEQSPNGFTVKFWLMNATLDESKKINIDGMWWDDFTSMWVAVSPSKSRHWSQVNMVRVPVGKDGRVEIQWKSCE